MSRLRPGLCPSLTGEIIHKLKAAGVNTVIDLVTHNLEELVKKSHVSYKDLVAIKRVVLAQYAAFPVSGEDLYQEVVASVAILSTSCPSLDILLDGGIYTAEVTEVIGHAAAGKTQFCLNVALSVATATEQNSLIVDTGGCFCSQRLQDILESRGMSAEEIEKICQRICSQNAFDVFELLACLEEIKENLTTQASVFYSSLKLLIVDNVASVISPILGGHQTDGHGFMMHVARALKTLATEHSIAVMVCNNAVQGDDGVRAALGKSWQHVPNTRLHLCAMHTPSAGETPGGERPTLRQASLLKSSRQSIHSKTCFRITDTGLQDHDTSS